MALNLSKDDLRFLKIHFEAAVPYEDDDPEGWVFDGKGLDFERWKSTTARMLLRQYASEQGKTFEEVLAEASEPEEKS